MDHTRTTRSAAARRHVNEQRTCYGCRLAPHSAPSDAFGSAPSVRAGEGLTTLAHTDLADDSVCCSEAGSVRRESSDRTPTLTNSPPCGARYAEQAGLRLQATAFDPAVVGRRPLEIRDTMRDVRPGPLLLTAAAACAVAHAAGILVAHPVWRYAEVLSIGLLLVHAPVSGLRAPRWAVPAALAVLLVDATLTMPADPDTDGYGWKILEPGADIDMPAGFEAGLASSWASLTATALLLVVYRSGAWRGRTAVAATATCVLFTGYAVVRIVDIWLAVHAAHEPYANSTDSGVAVTAAGLATLTPLALGLLAVALATALAGNGRWLASTGAALLVVVALMHLDASIDAVPLPLYAGERTALFTWDTITPTLSMPQPVPALTAIAELTAYLLLFAGLTASRRPTSAAPAEMAG